MSPVLPPFYLQAPSFTPMAHLPTARSLRRCQLRTPERPRTRRSGDGSPALVEFTPAQGLGSQHRAHHLLGPGLPVCDHPLYGPGAFTGLPHCCLHPSSSRARGLTPLYLERIWEPAGRAGLLDNWKSLPISMREALSSILPSE